MDTVGSTPGEVEIVPTPRTNSEVSLFDALVRKFTLGTWLAIAPRVLRLACSSAWPSSTETATGTFCSGSARRVAVTVTSWTVFSSALGAACWAWALIIPIKPRQAALRRDGVRGLRRRVRWVIVVSFWINSGLGRSTRFSISR